MRKISLEDRIKQIEIIADGRFEYIGTVGEYNGAGTKIKCRCLVDDHEWVGSINGIVNNRSGCPKCAGRTQTVDDYIKRIESTGVVRFLGVVGEYIGARTKVNIKYIKCGHIGEKTINQIVHGKQPMGCKVCKGKHQTKDDFIQRIEDDGKYKFVRINGDFIGNKTRVFVKCTSCGHVRDVNISNIVNCGRGCPECSRSGYKCDKPGFMYLVKWSDGDESFLKFGITNRKIIDRIKSQARKTKFEPNILVEIPHDSGSVSSELENEIYEIQKKYGGPYATKEMFGDGFTETIHIDAMTDVLNTISEFCFGLPNCIRLQAS